MKDKEAYGIFIFGFLMGAIIISAVWILQDQIDITTTKNVFTYNGTLVSVQNHGDDTYIGFSDGDVIRIWTKQENIMRYWLNKTITFEYTYVNQDLTELSNIHEIEVNK